MNGRPLALLNSCESTLINVTFYAKILNERDKSLNKCQFNEMIVFLC